VLSGGYLASTDESFADRRAASRLSVEREGTWVRHFDRGQRRFDMLPRALRLASQEQSDAQVGEQAQELEQRWAGFDDVRCRYRADALAIADIPGDNVPRDDEFIALDLRGVKQGPHIRGGRIVVVRADDARAPGGRSRAAGACLARIEPGHCLAAAALLASVARAPGASSSTMIRARTPRRSTYCVSVTAAMGFSP